MSGKKRGRSYKNEINDIRDRFNHTYKYSILTRYPDIMDELNYSPDIMKRRIAASSRYISRVDALLSDKFSGKPYLEAYIEMAVSVSQGTRHMDELYFPLLGAAIWLLDYLKEQNLIGEIIKLLPRNCDPIEDVYDMPFITDINFSVEMINSTVTVIMERKDKFRDIYNKIAGLIKIDDIQKLKKAYEDNVLEFIEIFTKYYLEALDEKTKDTETFEKQTLGAFHLLNLSFEEKFDRIESEVERINDKFVCKVSDFLMSAPFDINRNFEALKNDYGENAAGQLMKFGSGDPFKICAAYMFCLDDDNDVLYLTIPSAAVLSYGVFRLPWGNKVISHDIRFNKKPAGYDLVYGGIKRKPDTLCNFQQVVFSIDGCLLPRNQYIAVDFEESDTKLKPDICIPDDIMEKAIDISSIYFSFECGGNYDIEALTADNEIISADIAADSTEEPDNNLLENSDASIDDLKYQIELLSMQIKNLQSSLNEEYRNKLKLEKKYSDLTKQVRAEHDELISLRESLFIINNKGSDADGVKFDPDDSNKSKIILPYETKRNICVFGGHESWIKQIRPMLPNVKFIGCDIKPHPGLIKNADVVWLQSNSMPHKYYYAIINVVRSHNIDCRYFGYASAQMCAEQVVENELAIK